MLIDNMPWYQSDCSISRTLKWSQILMIWPCWTSIAGIPRISDLIRHSRTQPFKMVCNKLRKQCTHPNSLAVQFNCRIRSQEKWQHWSCPLLFCFANCYPRFSSFGSRRCRNLHIAYIEQFGSLVQNPSYEIAWYLLQTDEPNWSIF